MIVLKGRHPKVPAILKSDSKAAIKDLLALAKASAAPIFKEKDFPDHWGKHKYHFIEAQYKGKCAYCETQVIAGSSGDVEHFRPKAYCQALSSAANRNDYVGQRPGRRNVGARTEGYWWLAYDWRNYLLSCNRCNAVWKKNQFPVKAGRLAHGNKFSKEEPFLINPFKVDPEKHFDFNATTGQIRGLTPQGIVTIDVCGLDRRSLEVQRAIKGSRLDKAYLDYLVGLKAGNDSLQVAALRTLLRECRSKETYAAVARNFVKKKLKINYRDLLLMRRQRQI